MKGSRGHIHFGIFQHYLIVTAVAHRPSGGKYGEVRHLLSHAPKTEETISKFLEGGLHLLNEHRLCRDPKSSCLEFKIAEDMDRCRSGSLYVDDSET